MTKEQKQKMRETVITVKAGWLGEITASMGALNTLSIMAAASAKLCRIEYPDLPDAANLDQEVANSIYDALDAQGLYEK